MSTTVAWRVWEGSVVEGRFPLKQWLGGSDHSAVFLTDLPGQTPGKAAIKLIEASSAEADRLLSNWHAAAQLSHPHLIRIFESGRCQLNGVPLVYVLMEHAEENLQQIIPQRPLLPAEVSDMLPPLLDALAYVHGNGFVHGRVTPSNVLAVGDQLKLSSDRIAQTSEAGSGVSRRDVYDAPETAAGIVTPSGDLWSVGVTVVAALTQSVPFEGERADDPGLPASIPEPFRSIARECLRLDPERRCSIADIQARLQPGARPLSARTTSAERVSARTTSAKPEPVAPARSAGRGKMAGVLLGLALLLGLAVFYFRGKRGADEPPAEPAPQAASAPARPAPTPPPAETPKPEARKPAASSAGSVTKKVLPEVPKSAKNTITGHVKVSVRVQVDPSGKVAAAKLASAGPSAYFANLALKAAKSWEFAPPETNGEPTGSAWLLHFRFGRNGTDVSTERVKQ